MREITRALLSLCAAAGLFLALFLALQWNPFVSLAFSVGVYFGLFLLLKPSRKIGGISLEGLRERSCRPCCRGPRRTWKPWSALERKFPKRLWQSKHSAFSPQPSG